ncbi:MAG TPA: hypothetical protein VE891_04765 [Allosphingosinicella sp.]|nr:hypothetical protein [Allosphingosinicella sp.]
MIYLAAALFFTLALLAALVAIHVTVRLYWPEIILALRGEFGAATPRAPVAVPAGPARSYAAA